MTVPSMMEMVTSSPSMGGDHLTVREVGAHGRGVDHVVEQDVPEAFEGEEIFGCDFERSDQSSHGIIGRREHGEGAFTREGLNESGSTDGSLEQGVVFAVDDDVHHGGGLCRWVAEAQRR